MSLLLLSKGRLSVDKLKSRLQSHSPEVLLALLLAQPILDAFTYLVKTAGATVISGAVRTVILVAVSLYGFAITENRKVYYIFYGAVCGFWALHMLNCFRLGYADPFRDGGEYLKLVQLPLWFLTFLTFFRQREDLRLHAQRVLALNFALVLGIIALSWATGTQAYTYDIPARGVKMGLLGWFDVANSQSAIVCILVMGLLLWAYETGRFWVFSGACGLGFGLLYFTGTRLTYYSAFLIALGFGVLVLLAGGKMRLCCIPLAVVIALFIGFRGASVMEARQDISQDSARICQEPTDQIMGEDKDFAYTPGEEIPPEILEKITRVYTEVYGGLSFAGRPLLGDLMDRFGIDRVMEAYGYTTDAWTLYDLRVKKMTVMRLLWQEQDPLTKLLGMETAQVFLNGHSYDPETDIAALPYYYGWLGAGLYLCFVGYFLVLVLLGCVKHLRRLPEFLTPRLGVWTMILVLGLGAAQFSGQVLKKPSVTVYLSLALAEIYPLLAPDSKLTARVLRRPQVKMKPL